MDYARTLFIPVAILIASCSGLAQAQVSTVPLKIAILEGNNAVNSLSQLRSVAPVAEIRDQNEFPVEGATVVFTLPGQGPGGTFVGGETAFTTRSDARGQASTPLIVPRLPGKFLIRVTATAGDRKGEAVVTQTNSMGGNVGLRVPQRPWYHTWKVWAIVGGAAAGTAVAVVLTRGSGSKSTSQSTVVITPGVPVFQ